MLVGLFRRDLRGVIRVVGADKKWVAAGAQWLVERRDSIEHLANG